MAPVLMTFVSSWRDVYFRWCLLRRVIAPVHSHCVNVIAPASVVGLQFSCCCTAPLSCSVDTKYGFRWDIIKRWGSFPLLRLQRPFQSLNTIHKLFHEIWYLPAGCMFSLPLGPIAELNSCPADRYQHWHCRCPLTPLKGWIKSSITTITVVKN